MLAAVALLLVAVVILLVVLARKRRVADSAAAQPAAAQPAAASPSAKAEPAAEVVTVDFTRPDQAARLAGSFRRGLRDLRRYLGVSDYRYRRPWVLLVGETASGKSELLGRCGLGLPLGPPADPVPEEGSGCSWWLLEHGVVLDVAGDFVLGADGKSSSRRGWNQLLRALRVARPQRPLDGIVLAVPCAGLLGVETAAISQKAVLLSQKLREAQRQLGMMIPVSVVITGSERIPGFTSLFREVPESAWGEIFGWSSPYAPDTPFRPEWVDEGFETVHAGVRREQLHILGQRLQIDDPDGVFAFPHELLALREPLRTFLAALCRPSTFSETLRLRGFYLSGELGAEAVRAEAPPAGLPGTAEPGAAGLAWDGAAGGGTGGAGTVLFLRDLFEAKIFAERGLAHAAAGSLASRGRLVLAAQISLLAFIALAGLGTWWAHDRLAGRKDGLKRFLHETMEQVTKAHSEPRGVGVADGGCPDIEHAKDEPILTGQAFDFANRLASFDAESYRSVFLPSSWLSRFNREVRQVIRLAYDHLIFEALESGFRYRLREALYSEGLPPGETAPLRELSVEEMGAPDLGDLGDRQVLDETEVSRSAPDEPPLDHLPELKALSDYVDAVRELEARVRVYNGLKKTEDLKGLAELLSYLFKRPAPEGFLESDRLYRQALKLVEYRPIVLSCRAPEAQETAKALAGALIARLDKQNAVLLARHLLDVKLTEVSSRPTFNTAELEALELRITRVERALELPELAWIHKGSFHDSFQMWTPVQAVLAKIRGSELLGATAEKTIADDAETAWRDQLLPDLQRLAATGDPILEKEGAGKPWQLSANLVTLRKALADLRNESFMGQESGLRIRTTVQRGTRLFWEPRQLQAAADLYKPYEQFVQKGLARFPASLRKSLQEVARKRTADEVIGEVAMAQTLRDDVRAGDILGERNVADQVENLKKAEPPLTEVINVLDLLKAPASDELRQLTEEQAHGILRGVDRLLAAERPYLPRGGDFSWWEGDGDRAVVYAAYDVENAEELAAYLMAQRSRLSELADQYAEPALRMLGDADRHHDAALRSLILKWQAIVSALHGYEAKRPGNSVASLETWIAQGMADVRGENCLRVLKPARLTQGGLSDFFFQTANTLRGDLYKRCRDLTKDRVLIAYQDIEKVFNQRLAGRFPFSRGVPGALDSQADPEDLRAFFEVFDKLSPILLDLPDNDRRFGDDQPRVLTFIKRLKDVRKLFAGFLDDPLQPELPTFGFDVEFRVNRRADRRAEKDDGNQIIRWELTSGRKSFVRGGPESHGIWTAKDPVTVILQWAKDGQVGPLPPQQPPSPNAASSASQPRMTVDGPVVTYRFSGPWSLFVLLREYAGRPTDFAGGSDPRPQTLRFAVDTGPMPAGAEKDEDEKDAEQPPVPRERTGAVVVYVRVTLTSVDKDKPQDLELPTFPSQAPVLPENLAPAPAETARGAAP